MHHRKCIHSTCDINQDLMPLTFHESEHEQVNDVNHITLYLYTFNYSQSLGQWLNGNYSIKYRF